MALPKLPTYLWILAVILILLIAGAWFFGSGPYVIELNELLTGIFLLSITLAAFIIYLVFFRKKAQLVEKGLPLYNSLKTLKELVKNKELADLGIVWKFIDKQLILPNWRCEHGREVIAFRPWNDRSEVLTLRIDRDASGKPIPTYLETRKLTDREMRDLAELTATPAEIILRGETEKARIKLELTKPTESGGVF